MTPTVAWDYSQANSLAQTAYEVEVAMSANGAAIASATATGTATGAPVPLPPGGLAVGTTYYVRVRAACYVNASTPAYWGAWSVSSFTPVPPPPTVTLTAPSGVTSMTPTASWVYAQPTGLSQTAYELEVATAGGTVVGSASATGTVTSVPVPVPSGGFTSNTIYYVRVRAACYVNSNIQAHWSSWATSAFVPTASSGIMPKPGVTTTASAWWIEPDANGDLIPDSGNNTTGQGRGSISLTWKDVPGASSYLVYLHDGNQFRQVASTTATSWASAGKGIFRTDSAIAALSVGANSYSGNPYLTNGTGTDLRDDPRVLYKKTVGTEHDDRTDYMLKIVPSSVAISACETISVTLENRTIHANDDPRHTTYDIEDASVLGHGAQVVLDKGTAEVFATDLEIDWWGPRAALDRYYSSDRTTATSWAPGWRFNYEQAITLNQTGNIATYTDAAGEAHRFGGLGGAWISAHGFYGTLTKPGDWKITYKDGHTLTFDGTTGRLKSENDRNGNTVTYTLSGNNLLITAGNGHVITVNCNASGVVSSATYTASGTGGGTRTVTYATGVTPTVAYDYGVNDSANRTLSFGYTSGRLTSIAHTASGVTLGFDYGANGVVTCVRLPGHASNSYRRADVSYPASGYLGLAMVTRYGKVGATDNVAIAQRFVMGPNGTCSAAETPHVLSASTGIQAYTYSPTNEVASEISPLKHVTKRSVDGFGLVRDAYDADGGHTAYEYNSKGLCTRETDPIGSVTTRSYDASGNLTSEGRTLDASGTASSVSYAYTNTSFPGVMTSEVRSLNATESALMYHMGFAPSGKPLTTVQQTKLAPGDPGAAPIITHYTYDAFGNLETECLPATGAGPFVLATTEVYSVSGRLTSSTDAFGVETRYAYDELGRETETYRMHTGAPVGMQVDLTRWTYGANGKPATEARYLKASSSVATTSSVASYTYDALGRNTLTADSCMSGQPARTDYDAAGNVTGAWPAGVPAYDAQRADRSTYNADGRVTSSFASGDTTPSITFYSPAGRVLTTVDSGGKITAYKYDAAGNMVSEVSTVGTATATTSHTHDLGGRMVASVNPEGVQTTYAYDLADRKVSAGSAVQTASATFYGQLDWPLREVDADGIVTERTYNALGNTVTESVGGKVTSNNYDKGRLTWTKDPDGCQAEYQFDEFGNVTHEDHYDDRLLPSSTRVKGIATAYDTLGRVLNEGYYGVASAVVPVRTVSYTYPVNTHIQKAMRVDKYGSVTTTTTIGSNGLEEEQASLAPGIGSSISRKATARDMADRETTVAIDTNHNVPLAFNFEYDGSGRLERQWGAGLSASRPVGRSYVYDAESGKKIHDALTPASGLDPAISSTFGYTLDERLRTVYTVATGTVVHDYDDAGNITSVSGSSSGTATLTYNADNRLTAFKPAGSPTVLEIGYDGLGRRIAQGPSANKNQTRLAYTGTGRLASYDTSAVAGVDGTYSYDARGQRRRSVVRDSAGRVTTTDWVYDGLLLLSLSASRSDGATWEVTYLYDRAGSPYAGIYTGSDTALAIPFLMVTTDRGDVVSLLARDGGSFASYRYDQWGNPTLASSRAASSYVSTSLASSISERQVLRYAGYVWDQESKTYYCSARQYDPVTMQFLSKDPAKADGEESAYQYCGGDPVNNVDPSGCFAQAIPILAIPAGLITAGYILCAVVVVGTVVYIYYTKKHRTNRRPSNRDKHTRRRSGDPEKGDARRGRRTDPPKSKQ